MHLKYSFNNYSRRDLTRDLFYLLKLSMDLFDSVYKEITYHTSNKELLAKGYHPLYTAWPDAKIAVIWQAPGRIAQKSMIPRQDKSGEKLKQWMGISDQEFYNPNIISILPMDFYYPGKGSHGDLPPRKGFAQLWHPQLLDLMPHIELFILIGAYAQQHYLWSTRKKNLTETVRSYHEYLPQFFPLVHPSPLNFRRQAKNPRFEQQIVPIVQETVRKIIH